jgi:shikimate dehydrogenase
LPERRIPAIIPLVRNKLYLIGFPVEHSLSPQLHNSCFEKMKMPLTYSLRAIPPASFEEDVRAMLAEQDFLGANVTSPYKLRIVPLLEELRGDAAEIGVVNTIVRENDGKFVGFNTDPTGFLHALRESGLEQVRSVLVFGTGGGAQAVLLALTRVGCGRFVVVHRSERNVDAVRKLMSKLGQRVRMVSLAQFQGFFKWAEREEVFGEPSGLFQGDYGFEADNSVYEGCESTGFDKGPKKFDLLVNATPMGLHPHPQETIADHPRFLRLFLAVADLVYNPLQTKLLFLAQMQGCQTINGRRPLQHQAALSRELWLRQLQLSGEKREC